MFVLKSIQNTYKIGPWHGMATALFEPDKKDTNYYWQSPILNSK